MKTEQQIGHITIQANFAFPDCEGEELEELAEKLTTALRECASTNAERSLSVAVAAIGETHDPVEDLPPEVREAFGIEDDEEPAPISEEEIREPTDEELAALCGETPPEGGGDR